MQDTPCPEPPPVPPSVCIFGNGLGCIQDNLALPFSGGYTVIKGGEFNAAYLPATNTWCGGGGIVANFATTDFAKTGLGAGGGVLFSPGPIVNILQGPSLNIVVAPFGFGEQASVNGGGVAVGYYGGTPSVGWAVGGLGCH